ncbi:MAG: NAD-dependent epimerase/dehydratase family protein [Candidatus Omnitrophica bacterium]|nr:NAD-dependent epimerase/dehydratase family protein [Candidatus Omnitrophota bacterium]
MTGKKRRKAKALITGSGGLIGSQAAHFFASKKFEVLGIDNDMRRYFFGPEASTAWNIRRLKKEIPSYRHSSADIRDAKAVDRIFREWRPDVVIHAAAQPSHDWAVREPETDFTVNANGTLALLEAFRRFTPGGVFIFTSTNKVYGDAPNRLPLVEHASRYELPQNHPLYRGINESMSIDQSCHSLFGASKTAADIFVQEYGRYFGLKTVSFRGGCLTGPMHSAAELHGFLAYLGKCIATGRTYRIFGYKGKQVRDNIHAHDFVQAMYHFYLKPRPGEVYNMGGGRFSNISIREAIEKFEQAFGKKADVAYVKQNRPGDHQWYISDVSKFKKHYPGWQHRYSIDAIIDDICRGGHF